MRETLQARATVVGGIRPSDYDTRRPFFDLSWQDRDMEIVVRNLLLFSKNSGDSFGIFCELDFRGLTETDQIGWINRMDAG